MNVTSLNAVSINLTASPAPVCMCNFAPSLISLGTTDGTSATRRSCGCVSFKTATFTYINLSGVTKTVGLRRGHRSSSERLDDRVDLDLDGFVIGRDRRDLAIDA